MAVRARPALGLSIGSTNLAAVTADLALVRKPVLTLYRQRGPEVGVPSENPRLDEPGLVVTDFVDRVGDSVGIVAADGSVHRSGALIADALRALAYAATGGRPLPESVAVTYPAHWSAKSVDALRGALRGVVEWSDLARPPVLISDAAATLTAVRTSPGIPGRGTVAVCDFGGSGTSITLMDAAGDQPIAPTVRHHDFCGDMIDQALLTAVMANMPSTGAFDPSGTSAIGSLSRLRTGCRGAKEQLSSNTVATLSDVRLTRDELDDAIRDSLNNFVALLDESLRRNGIRDLVAVVSVGGGANIPAVTTRLSGHLRVPVVTTPRPQLAAATGAALRAERRPDDNGPTAQAPAATATATATAAAAAWAPAAVSGGMPARAWAQDGAGSSAMPTAARPWPKTAAGAAVKVEEPEPAAPAPKKSVIPWRRLPLILVLGALAVMVLAGVALAIGLGSNNQVMTNPGASTTPASPAPPTSTTSSPPPPPTQQPPPPSSPDTTPAPAPDTPTAAAPPAVQDVPAAPAPPPPRAAIPRIRIPEIPPLPPIPGLNAPIPGFPEIPTLISQIAPRAH
ncbi:MULTISPECIES: Hsp70 family protein [unclassified Mycobacterium]|uniref:Hsp70 family protein n=1 Tax=unclassified Mycobacterium TaxID=2642494 RepID=UPI0007FD54C6|nr:MULTISPECIES: Hsp70 family protein [unclassified Mycobacterium]OBH07108.1 molecular chaperone [Mycobacterium sp. E2699]OBI56723.1 molecular chaperone [Mycobacterium sp. E787]